MMRRISRREFMRKTAAGTAAGYLGLTGVSGALDAAVASETASTSKAHAPNIVFVLADDFGYGSLNYYGANKDLIRTPNIDRIAAQGVHLTNASSIVSVCTPTRYSLLTGEYSWRKEELAWGVAGFHDPLLIDRDRESLAGMLKRNGYQTAMIGKWHLGYGEGTSTRETWIEHLTTGPLDVGFDYHFGVPHNHGTMINVFVENETVYGLRSDRMSSFGRSWYGPRYWGIDAPQRVNENVTQDLTDKAIEWLRKRDKEAPFFLYFAPVAVHHPITPSPYMRGKSDAGAYGDFIQDLDHSVGQLFQALEYMGVADNTLFIFTSDDGGDIPGDPETPERQAIDSGLETNAPFRGDKHTIWEGGHRVPFVARWPGHIPEGSSSDAMINITDVLATLTELVEGKPPSSEAAPDSFSFLPALLEPDGSFGTARESRINGNMGGMLAIRRGPWKYIEGVYPDVTPEQFHHEPNEPQLYNLDQDIREENNVIEAYPEIAAQLQRELDAIREAPSERVLMETHGDMFRLDD